MMTHSITYYVFDYADLSIWLVQTSDLFPLRRCIYRAPKQVYLF